MPSNDQLEWRASKGEYRCSSKIEPKNAITVLMSLEI